MQQTPQGSHPTSPTYKEGTSGRANRHATQEARENKVQCPPISLLKEDEVGGGTPAVGRPQGSVKLELIPVQVHLEQEKLPRHLITFHICIWWEPASSTINRPLLHPLNTHTHTPFHHCLQGGSLSLSLFPR